MDPKQAIGEWLRIARLRSGRTREDVAQRAGGNMTAARLQRMEATRQRVSRDLPSMCELLNLADVYDADASDRLYLLASLSGRTPAQVQAMVWPEVDPPVLVRVSGGQEGEAEAVVAALPDMMRARGLTRQPVVVRHG